MRCGCCSGTSPRPSSRSGAPATCSAMARFASRAAHAASSSLGPGVVMRRRRRHDLHVDALPVHLGEARVERREQRHPLADHAARGGEALGAVAAGLERLRRGEPLGVACADRLLQGRQQQVRVHVDDRARSRRVAMRRSCRLAHEHRDAAHQAGHVGVAHVVDLPLAELARMPRRPRSRAAAGARGTRPTGRRRRRRAPSSSSESTRASSAACAAPWAIVGGQLCAASPMITTRPRFQASGTTCLVNHV